MNPTMSPVRHAPTQDRKLPGASPGSILLAPLRFVWHWAPVWVPLILLWQFADRGLRPALEEDQRLKGLAPLVEATYDDSRQAFEILDGEARAWRDPVYRERRRRAELLASGDL